MKKSDFWKIVGFVDSNCDYSTLRWFIALAYYYVAHSFEIDQHMEVDQYLKVSEFFNEEK